MLPTGEGPEPRGPLVNVHWNRGAVHSEGTEEPGQGFSRGSGRFGAEPVQVDIELSVRESFPKPMCPFQCKRRLADPTGAGDGRDRRSGPHLGRFSEQTVEDSERLVTARESQYSARELLRHRKRRSLTSQLYRIACEDLSLDLA